MLDEEILELRRKLDESITKEKNYDKTYRLSIELDKLITKYYNKKLTKNKNVDIWKNISNKWECKNTFSLVFYHNITKILQKYYILYKTLQKTK